MNKYIAQIAIITTTVVIFATASPGGAIAQSVDKRTEGPTAPPTVPLVDARQSGVWTVGVDPVRNTVRLANSEADPVPVKVISSEPVRKPFQMQLIVAPYGPGYATTSFAIPAGKRMVIENISAFARSLEGTRLEINFLCYFDNGDGIGDINDLTYHRIALIDQGILAGTQISTANHKVLIFADERIGTSHYSLVMRARVNTETIQATAQAQLVFTGYMEDLPAVQ
jgi:hypothetical protein